MDIREKFTRELQIVEWAALVPHFDRGGVVEIDGSLNLVDVGIAMANDNSGVVAEWLSYGLISQPDKFKSDTWVSQGDSFQFLIVQPYVLVQKVELHG